MLVHVPEASFQCNQPLGFKFRLSGVAFTFVSLLYSAHPTITTTTFARTLARSSLNSSRNTSGKKYIYTFIIYRSSQLTVYLGWPYCFFFFFFRQPHNAHSNVEPASPRYEQDVETYTLYRLVWTGLLWKFKLPLVPVPLKAFLLFIIVGLLSVRVTVTCMFRHAAM